MKDEVHWSDMTWRGWLQGATVNFNQAAARIKSQPAYASWGRCAWFSVTSCTTQLKLDASNFTLILKKKEYLSFMESRRAEILNYRKSVDALTAQKGIYIPTTSSWRHVLLNMRKRRVQPRKMLQKWNRKWHGLKTHARGEGLDVSAVTWQHNPMFRRSVGSIYTQHKCKYTQWEPGEGCRHLIQATCDAFFPSFSKINTHTHTLQGRKSVAARHSRKSI